MTSIIGIINAEANAFAKETPTNKDPNRPGPFVKATAFSMDFVIFALASASETTGTIFCWWAREANSGTIPPYFWCIA